MFRQNSSEVPFGPSNHWLSATANSLWEGFVPTLPRLRFSTLTTIAPSKRRNTTLFRYAKFFAKASHCYVSVPKWKGLVPAKKEAHLAFIPRKPSGLVFHADDVSKCSSAFLQPLPHNAETHSSMKSRSCKHPLELPQAEGFDMNAFQSNNPIKTRVHGHGKHWFQIDCSLFDFHKLCISCKTALQKMKDCALLGQIT